MKKVLIAFVFPVFLYSCSPGWPDEYKKDYMSTCIEDARSSSFPDSAHAAAYCECSLHAVMTHYPTIEEMLVNKDSLALRDELQACRDGIMAQ